MTLEALTYKFQVINDILKKQHADAFLISSYTNRLWITGLQTTAGIVIVDKQSVYLFIDDRYFQFAKQALQKYPLIQVHQYSNQKILTDFIKKKHFKKILIEADYMTIKEQLWFEKILNQKLIPYDTAFLRITKTSDELKLMQKAADIAIKAINQLKKIIKVGMTETEVARWISNFMLENGAQKNSFDLIVAFGKHSAIPHHRPTNYALKKSEFILIDIGCIYQGYCSDITRTFWIGKPTKTMLEIYRTVLNANIAAIQALKPNIKGYEVDQVARNYIAKNSKYGKCFIHNTGHGVGIEIHEDPRNAPNYNGILPKNSVVTIEPGIYLPKLGGVRIEDTIVVGNKPIILTKNCPKNLND